VSEDRKILSDAEMALNAIERDEMSALTWGFVDASISETDAEKAIEDYFSEHSLPCDPVELLDSLVDLKLVRMWRKGNVRRYRSRFAEFVRLAARLRQLFPSQPWRAASTLVSDYRLQAIPRSYPRRNIRPKEVQEELDNEEGPLTPLQMSIWNALLPSKGELHLSRFQVEATKRIFRGLPGHGSIITAGTGSGKTLAFYLPAILKISEQIEPNSFFTKAVSLYPRNELLKDQLSEVYKLCLRLGPELKNTKRRKLTLGALYGQVPNRAVASELEQKGWIFRASGHICPFVRCPECEGELKWLRNNLEANIEKLDCGKCSFSSDPDDLRLTRDSMRKFPPDLLFSTTEMLNQRLSDTEMSGLFGVGPGIKKPGYILLDEVHTYSGPSGAQTALLLRRWKALLGARVHWVGLSATLREASHFFADLSGLPIDAISEITPKYEDLEEEGAEYQVLLRSDPSSQAATLSTSIQTLMLLARMMDTRANPHSNGIMGRRVFAFTDDLDVTHRLFDDLRDAEAFDRFGRPDDQRSPLASLRSSLEVDPEEREAEGQNWRLPEDIRNGLQHRLTIGRTTSRDPGVEGTADVVVATASLEVGFNDPEVGAVVQHKAPRSFASFVQRKGRAGRQRGMRPVTVTVLSDYGRDRLAFQAYEQLFSPEIERQLLPVNNVYILRIQSVLAMFDWIAKEAAEKNIRGWSWDSLSRPPASQWDKAFRTHIKAILRDLAKLDPETITRLSNYIRVALDLDQATINEIFWESPRPLLLEAIPTLARRFFTDWRLAKDTERLDLCIPYHPLPDFVPRQLFGELNLPEVQITVPPARKNGEPKEESLRIRQALTEFAPGRVRRRFADEYGGLAHWTPLDIDQPNQTIQISDFAQSCEYLGTFNAEIGGIKNNVKTFRPWSMKLQTVNVRQIRPSSNSQWTWNSEFEYLGVPIIVDLPEHAAWRDVIERIEFYVHRVSSAVTVRRFAHQGVASLGVGGETRQIEYSLVDETSQPAAVGFAFEADGLLVPIKIPTSDTLQEKVFSEAIARWLRVLQFRDIVNHDPQLPKEINSFRREWLCQVIIFSAIEFAEKSNLSIAESIEQLAARNDVTDFSIAMSAIAAMEHFEDEPGDTTRLEDTLMDCLSQSGVVRRLLELAGSVLGGRNGNWGEWLRNILCTTIAESILQACILATPKNTAIEGLTNEIIEREGQPYVLIVESTIGGGGTIEALAERFAGEPRSFFRAMDAALATSDSENAANGLHKILDSLQSDVQLTEAVSKMRAADNKRSRERARVEFVSSLADHKVQFSQSLGVSFATRFIRPGANTDSDQLTYDLIKNWAAIEEKYDLSLSVRLASSLSVLDSDLKKRLSPISGPGNEIAAADMLLWSQSGELRQYALQSYNPYRNPWVSDAGLVRELVWEGLVETVDISSENWKEELGMSLSKKGIVHVMSSKGAEQFRGRILDLLAYPVVVDYLHLFPCIDGVQEDNAGNPVLTLTLHERT
jgi:hypothetical protein